MCAKIREVIVVEGRHDTSAIRKAVQADTIETGGSALRQETLERIKLLQARRGVIVFTDPDYPGKRLRHLIEQAVPGCKHAFLPARKAKSSSGRVGVEHGKPEDILQALLSARTAAGYADPKSRHEGTQGEDSTISWEMLLTNGCVGGEQARLRREHIGEYLGIGYANAKQFYRRLHMFRVTAEQFRQACLAAAALLDDARDEVEDE